MSGGNDVFTNDMDYASASWEGGDSERIPEINLDNNVVPGKYKTTVSNILSKQCAEIKNTTEEVTHHITNVSKKKLKDLITKHNNEIFSFLARPDKTPNIIGIAETIFRRYGHDVPSIRGSTVNTVLRDLNLDASMNKAVAEFDEGLKKINGAACLEDFLKQTRWMYTQYKNIGEEVLRLETILYQKLENLDKLNNRLPLLTSLTNNDALPDLLDSFMKYADKIFKESHIEENYKELVEVYKRWNICRQIISLNNVCKSDTREPQCSICLIEAVSMAIVPCGHTFCSACAKKQNTNCYICRGGIRERVKLFFT